MELSTILLLGGAGIIVIGAGLYVLTRKDSPKEIILKNKSRLYPVVKKLPNKVDIQEWTAVIVDINKVQLTNWWKVLVSENGRDTDKITNSLIGQLKQWQVDLLWDISFEPQSSLKEVARPYNLIMAKRAFVENLKRFSTLLATLHKGVDIKKWTEVIVDINDYDLVEFWEKMVKQPDIADKLIKILSSWQIKGDTCKSFTCLTQDNIMAYQLPDGSELEIGQKYKVESPCWIFTSEDNDGNVSKSVIIKGVVIPKTEA